MQIKKSKYYAKKKIPYNWKKLVKYEPLVLPKMRKLP